MQVIKDRTIIDDDCSLIRDIESTAPIPEGDVILPFVFWEANRIQLLKSKKKNMLFGLTVRLRQSPCSMI